MAAQVDPKRQQELQMQYSNFKTTLHQLAQKIGDIETEAEEHKLVIESLQPLPLDRKCFRMINGVLVERTVLDELMKQYKSKQDEMDNWKKKNHIQVVQQ
ncbi:prefoldin subunit 2 [Trichophyton equinum CBS 127.97]|uniref:Prefoldin subunit 2 n=1 Tax=Trichophyton equinum (strain ATCC MYA-4606 / CBS 127.97) TaxID=559882 RepID=F2PWR4_TRIEC|nr:prefoldin subunit 2 [Trichophyton equinum CBS 127.97]